MQQHMVMQPVCLGFRTWLVIGPFDLVHLEHLKVQFAAVLGIGEYERVRDPSVHLGPDPRAADLEPGGLGGDEAVDDLAQRKAHRRDFVPRILAAVPPVLVLAARRTHAVCKSQMPRC